MLPVPEAFGAVLDDEADGVEGEFAGWEAGGLVPRELPTTPPAASPTRTSWSARPA
ncbi:hypothetical protein AB0F17_24630 [Nonomuraea sp. NPDC026600]|uniref:hypothetical protein n=1 Tax=Nonomuraea sp. NPDC026600 TaxID=3155363 RepID=UPI0033D5BFE3